MERPQQSEQNNDNGKDQGLQRSSTHLVRRSPRASESVMPLRLFWALSPGQPPLLVNPPSMGHML